MAFPSENRCETQQKKSVNKKLLYNLKKSVESFYNKRDRLLANKKTTQTSSCFNLRHAEMYVNYLIQVQERSAKICVDHLEKLTSALDHMMDLQSEENKLMKTNKEKLTLIDLSMEVSRYSEALKMETQKL